VRTTPNASRDEQTTRAIRVAACLSIVSPPAARFTEWTQPYSMCARARNRLTG
jgi:hypothetical protein